MGVDLPDGRRNGHLGGAQGETGGGLGLSANEEALAVLFDLGIVERIEV